MGYRFKDRAQLYQALTHRSAIMELSSSGVCSDALPWNERFEFLGDAVLGLAISRRLMDLGQGLVEGELSRIRAALVNEVSLAVVARTLDLGRFLVLGKGAAKSGGRKRDSLLADGLEAVIGAVFNDGGFAAAEAVVDVLFGNVLRGDLMHLVQTDFKTMLQELTQEKFKKVPSYEVLLETGPDHNKVFEVRVILGTEELGRGSGASKKRASQAAAQQAFSKLSNEGEGEETP
ncbi:ribonuclease 3 [Planctomyces bekefii]|uniref:Ribonuclease 3 n=1 Tax=Planctomyces bekefii TaxID=1653850 RepID=A0A5C6MAB6_9PLAN|nr:ribonuclease 3 [Planctomyces bekefii]